MSLFCTGRIFVTKYMSAKKILNLTRSSYDAVFIPRSSLKVKTGFAPLRFQSEILLFNATSFTVRRQMQLSHYKRKEKGPTILEHLWSEPDCRLRAPLRRGSHFQDTHKLRVFEMLK